jgi:antitoxin component YwqK of YwqJK toxin-antitoxin module
MKKLFPLLLITILFSQDKEVIVERHSNGVKKSIIIYEGEGSNEKLIRKLGFYNNGKLQFSTNWKDGKRNGNVIVNYENGELGFKGKYLNDRLDGSIVYYYTDGKVHLESKIQFNEEGNSTLLKELFDRNEIDDTDEEIKNEIFSLGYIDSINTYSMIDIKIYDENGKRYENLFETEMFNEDYPFIYENEIVEILYTLIKFNYRFFRGGLNKD